MIRWAGDDPDRPGMADTPAQVLAFYEEFFKGYGKQAADYAGSIANDTTFEDFILVKDINIASFCEHHMLPATGTAHIAYIPGQAVAGIGTLARIAEDCARRLSTQETVTSEIISMINEAFVPAGIAVMVTFSHGCMTLRGGQKKESTVTTTKFSGIFHDNPDIQKQFLIFVNEES